MLLHCRRNKDIARHASMTVKSFSVQKGGILSHRGLKSTISRDKNLVFFGKCVQLIKIMELQY